ncbi:MULTISPECIES: response regulator [Caldilinea]|jgi:two-component system response regulator NreC|uniref:Putative two-component response regulator n=1 Tax=Caldilinea aerophila (strain DSM 14535 / JCM 11387 / NBRC 104270 / STL-6-O1) TaxID=926550 RepID=I0HZD7_CALAS|nr:MULTISPECIES: response regulator transcription factor [Caldilinea]BAL98374.1 putative two-component response regulator [Caldilinea aerophila DSM 14535 = NBRC 104270]GIV75042.1 MAG: DNA-binding response regulator [Caldilinea sp.]
MNKIRILVADDHAILQAGLEAMLNAEADMHVVGSASDGHAAVRQAALLQPDIILLDINMPGLNGLEALERIRAQAPRSRVLILTMHDDAQYLRQAMANGAAGYVLKQSAGKELLTAIRTVCQGGVYLHPNHARALATPPQSAASADAQPSEAVRRFQLLSEREREVFRLVALGYRNSEIADRLSLSVKTVETYKSRMMDKLGLQTRTALVRFALEVGILQKTDSSTD